MERPNRSTFEKSNKRTVDWCTCCVCVSVNACIDTNWARSYVTIVALKLKIYPLVEKKKYPDLDRPNFRPKKKQQRIIMNRNGMKIYHAPSVIFLSKTCFYFFFRFLIIIYEIFRNHTYRMFQQPSQLIDSIE